VFWETELEVYDISWGENLVNFYVILCEETGVVLLGIVSG